MTNSCVSSKWLPHIQTGNYGMSQNCIDESKEYIFVKLTDSAYRAVEEYQKNETKYNARAKIQVIGNGGVISFPTVDDSEGQKFGFAIDDIEGSFECIKQTQNAFDVLGTLPYKMRIQANDDVYEKTRHRMAVAEETQKNKCTREIKPNQTVIGRKVKLKSSGGGSSNSSNGGGNSNGRDSGGGNNNNSSGGLNNSGSFINGNSNNGNGSRNSMNGNSSSVLPKRDSTSSTSTVNSNNNNNSSFSNTLNNTSGSSSNNNSNHMGNPLKITSNSRSPNTLLSSSALSSVSSRSSNNNNLVGMPTSASALSSGFSSAAGSGTSGISNGYFRGNSPESKINSNKNNLHLGYSSNNNRSKGKGGMSGNGIGGSSNNNRHKGNDVTKRTIRERLIHILALKPYKKPELFARLQNEGIRDREKSLLTTILKEISTMRDNTYNLKRALWNDVDENWQFYTEQELQMLKRRKPQNLTPPISSDAGSSTSGQSPTSTHTGSPPQAIKRPPSLDHHRDRCYDDPLAKKQRISHFRKDTNNGSNNSNSNINSSSNNSNNGNINSSNSGNHNLSSANEKNQNFITNQNHIDNDENSVDLSYSVIENDEFLMGASLSGSSNRRTTSQGSGNITNNTSNLNTTLSSAASSAGGGGGLKLYHNNNNKSPYNEVAPTGKKSSPYNSNNNSNNNNNNNNITSGSGSVAGSRQNASPNVLTNNSKQNNNSSVIYSPNQQQQSSAINHSNSGNSNIYSQHKSQYQHHQQQQPPPPHQQQSVHYQQPQQPIMQSHQVQQHNKQQHHHSQQQHPHQKYTQQHQQHSQLPAQPHQYHSQHQHQQPQHHTQQPPQHQQSQQPQFQSQQQNQTQNQSKTSKQGYDFSRYAKITSIEQRRQYKTEFENDYAEYRQLLKQIEDVGNRFQVLANRLHCARNDADYINIKKQIVNEYERIRKEKAHQRDKMRFDYLHVKLTHIKGLVSDYDKSLTDAGAMAAPLQQGSSSSLSPDPAGTGHYTLNGNPLISCVGTDPSTGGGNGAGYFTSNKTHLTPSPPHRMDGAGGGGGPNSAGGGSGNIGPGREGQPANSGKSTSGGVTILENGPTIHHQSSHHMLPNDDDAY